jgi:glutamine synthetase
MPGNLSFDQLRTAAGDGGIDTVLVCFVDMQGRLIGKRFQAEYFLESAHDETHGCDYLLANDIDMEPVPGYAAANWEKGYGDFVMKPDMTTLRRIPWLQATALVLCDVLDHHTHEDLAHSPRGLLRRQVARLSERGMRPFIATELEFYLFDETFETAAAKALRGPEDRRLLHSGLSHPADHQGGAGRCGPSAKACKGRHPRREIERRVGSGSGGDQRPLRRRAGNRGPTCDPEKRLSRRSHTAWARPLPSWRSGTMGWRAHPATFTPRSGMRRAKTPLFLDQNAEHGISPLMRRFMAGQLKYAADITWFLAPYVNSYKRFQVGTFAPTKAIWSRDNRTAGFRLCAEASKGIRVECRIGGADLNPYLAIAALLAAGLAGIDEELELEPAFVGDAYQGAELRQIPKTLRDAIMHLEGSTMLRNAFSEAVIDHYVHTARWEQFEYDRRVTDWELKRGFERS